MDNHHHHDREHVVAAVDTAALQLFNIVHYSREVQHHIFDKVSKATLSKLMARISDYLAHHHETHNCVRRESIHREQTAV